MKQLKHAQEQPPLAHLTEGENADLRAGADRAPLSDEEIDFLGTQIPAQAVAATQAAFWSALTSGQSVVCADGDELYEIFPDGSRRFIKSLPRTVLLTADTKLILK